MKNQIRLQYYQKRSYFYYNHIKKNNISIMIKLSSHNRYLIILNIKSYQIINILIKSGIYK